MIVTIYSCDKEFLERLPKTDNVNEIALSDYTGMNQGIIGAYSIMYDVSWYGAAFPILADIKADNAKSSPINTGRYQTNYNWNQDAANTSGLWTTGYIAITSASNVIDAIAEYELQPGEDIADFNHLKAEALFIRALAHFDLLRVFAQPYSYQPNGLGVPIILKTEIALPARNTTTEVFAQIIADLQEAEGLFKDGFERAGTDPRAWADKRAAQALLARVYLYMEDWANAAAYASTVINSGDFTLYNDANYAAAWGADAADEVIFEIWGNYTQTDAPYWAEIGRMYNHAGYGDVCATDGLLALFEAGDVRATMFYSPAAYPGTYWPTKYPGKSGDLRQNNIPVLRLSEMYLIRAEAVLNGAAGNALADYNAIRTNRGLASASSVTQNDIFDERRRELCFEGHLLFDYARQQRSLDRVDESNRLSGIEDVPFPNYLWAMPIPLAEMDANINMEQNPGY